MTPQSHSNPNDALSACAEFVHWPRKPMGKAPAKPGVKGKGPSRSSRTAKSSPIKKQSAW